MFDVSIISIIFHLHLLYHHSSHTHAETFVRIHWKSQAALGEYTGRTLMYRVEELSQKELQCLDPTAREAWGRIGGKRCPNFVQLRFNQKHATDCPGLPRLRCQSFRNSKNFSGPLLLNPEDYELQMSYLRNMSCVEANLGSVRFMLQGWCLDGRPFIGIRQSPFRQVPAYPGLQFRSPTFFDGRIIASFTKEMFNLCT